MIKVKCERPLLFNGVAQTEFETTNHHARELEAKGLAVLVGEGSNEPEPEPGAKAVVATEVVAEEAAETKTTAKRK